MRSSLMGEARLSRLATRSHDLADRTGKLVPRSRLGDELSFSDGGELVVFRTATVFRQRPLRFDPAAVLHAVERWIQRALLDLKRVLGRVLYPARDAESVHRSPRQRLEDDEIECALEQFDRRHACSLRRSKVQDGLNSLGCLGERARETGRLFAQLSQRLDEAVRFRDAQQNRIPGPRGDVDDLLWVRYVEKRPRSVR